MHNFRNYLKYSFIISSAFTLAAWDQERDYLPDWVAISGVDTYDGIPTKKSSIPIARIAPKKSFLLTNEVNMKGRNILEKGTILIGIENNPTTACEMIRPKGHESFYCLVDSNNDGNFDKFFHLFSNSYFLLSGWTNRKPEPFEGVSYKATDSDSLKDYVTINLEFPMKKKNSYVYSITFSSNSRKDKWVFLGELKFSPDRIGKKVNILGSNVSLIEMNDTGTHLRIQPSPAGHVVQIQTPKGTSNNWDWDKSIHTSWSAM